MDCEKFDQHVIDALYDELDELTHAALRRHVEGCSRCAAAWAGLRATREVGILPIEEPPDDMEARILDAAFLAQKRVPVHKKVLRGLAWAGSHAMRPQLAMAALFFLVIGSSLILLRARPGTLGPLRVTENGAPVPAAEAVAEPPAASPTAATVAMATAAPSAQAGGAPEGPASLAEGAYGGPRQKAEIAAGDKAKEADKDAADPRAALAAAIAVRDASGCGAAVGQLDAVAVRFGGTQAAADAMWNEAACYKQMGNKDRAQQIWLALRSTGYRDRADAELGAGDNNANANNNFGQVAAGRAVAAAPAAAPPPPPAAKPVAAAEASAAASGATDQPGAAGPGNAKASKRAAPAAAPKSQARPSPARDAYGY